MIDLDTVRLVPEEEVAALFGVSVGTLRSKVYSGKFPIRPKLSYPMRWSSVELKEWLSDGRKRDL